MINSQIGYQAASKHPAQRIQMSPSELINTHWGRTGVLTPSGRDGVSLLCSHLKLGPDDDVSIFSTRSNKFVSSHVTCPIFNHARPSKVVTAKTKLLYVIHLFGEIYEDLDAVYELAASRGLPVVEDCAHTMWTHRTHGGLLCRADYVLFSIPKAFAINHGGVLLGDLGDFRQLATTEFLNALNSELMDFDQSLERRLRIYRDFSNALDNSFCHPLFRPTDTIWPYVFPFTVVDETAAIHFMTSRLPNVEICSWNARGLLSVPVHQGLSDTDVLKICETLRDMSARRP